MYSNNKALLYALTAVMLWSTVATAFKIALRYNNVLPLLLGASTTSLFCIGVALAFRRKLLVALRSFPAHWRQTVALGLINPVIYYLVLFEAYRRLPAQVAQPVNYTWAIVLALLSIPILNHRLARSDLIGLLLGFSGILIISVAGKNVTGELDSLGLALAILSTLLWAIFWLLNTRTNQDSMIQLFHNFLFATPVLLLLSMVFQQSSSLSLASILSLVYVGLFEMGITFLFWQQALTLTSQVARIGSLIFLSPFISLFIISAILGEPLQWETFAGLGLIIVGVVLVNRKYTNPGSVHIGSH